MATIFEDNFNSYTDGDLHGQGDWSGSTDFDIQGTTVKEGDKAVRNNTENNTNIIKVGSQVADGKITVYLRIGSTNGANAMAYFVLREGATHCVYTRLYGQTMQYYSGTWVNLATGLAYDTFHCLEIEWRSSDKKARYRCDGGAWTDWLTPLADFTNYLDTVHLELVSNSGVVDIFYDYIAENPITFTRTISESMGILDSIIRSQGWQKLIQDNIGMTDILSWERILSRLIQDDVGITDILTYLRAMARSIQDTVGITDLLVQQSEIARIIADNLGISDTIAFQVIFERLVQDNIGITDVLSAIQTLERLIQDSVGITDSLSLAKSLYYYFPVLIKLLSSKKDIKLEDFKRIIKLKEE